jgi:hypothetical protein
VLNSYIRFIIRYIADCDYTYLPAVHILQLKIEGAGGVWPCHDGSHFIRRGESIPGINRMLIGGRIHKKIMSYDVIYGQTPRFKKVDNKIGTSFYI